MRLKDTVVTLTLWGYFTIGFVLFFSPFYLLAFFFAKERAAVFQRLNSRFYGGFFRLCRLLMPQTQWEIDPRVREIRSAIVVCNHISYLDSILLVSLFMRHTTIAKDRLFRIPLLGRLLVLSGYIPSSGGGRFADLLMDSFDTITANLGAGGNIIVFPEGTRSRDGRLGALQKGAFKIARYCRAPIKVLKIQNTDQLFTPGKFLFNTCTPATIVLDLVAEITPDYESSDFSIPQLMTSVQNALKSGVQDLRPPSSP
ncbi:MAG: lysophospholipid acyltransferase family protein [Desulfobacteraceae bacterium]